MGSAPPAPPWAAEPRSAAELAQPDTLRDHEDLLFRLHRLVRPRSYVEIGVNQGHSLRWALPSTQVVGIDPALQLDHPPPAPQGATLFATTSDEAFADPRLDLAVDGRIDLAFVDGLHLVEQVLRDVASIQRLSHPGTAVLLHDTLPPEPASAQRDRSTLLWTGDVWKAVVALRQTLPQLEVVTLRVPPSGVTVIRGLDPSDRTLTDRHGELVSLVAPLDWEGDALGREDEVLGAAPGTWSQAVQLVADLA
jgi:hypothetical protein